MILSKFAAGALGTVLAAGALISTEGFVRVRVHSKREKGSNIFVIAPGVLAPVGLKCVPKGDLSQAARELQPWMPTIRAALESLRKQPDMTLVEVTDARQHVRVAKDGGSIVVDVDDPEETVHVSAPLLAIRSSIEQISAAVPST